MNTSKQERSKPKVFRRNGMWRVSRRGSSSSDFIAAMAHAYNLNKMGRSTW